MKTREQNSNNKWKWTEIERFDWFIQRIQTRVAFGWLSERSGEKGAGSIFFLGLGLVSTLTLTLKQRSLKRRDLDSGTGPDTFRSDLEGYYWVVRKRQTQDELRL